MTSPIATRLAAAPRACDLGAEIPVYVRAVIEALRFRSPNLNPLAHLSEADWGRALSFCDHSMLTLPLGLRCGDALPVRIRKRIASDLQKNAGRWPRTQASYQEIADALDADGIEFTVLKGFSQCPRFVPDPRHRAQEDIDLLFAPDAIIHARDTVRRLGYEPIEGFENFPIDHLARMVRKTGWRWRGDFFDAERPLSVELHFRLWDAETEGFAPEGLSEFRERRQIRVLDRTIFPELHDADALAYSTLHLLRHLLRGDLRVSHVYELAAFLEAHAADRAFWSRWRSLHPASLRRLQAIGFSLASRWFDCDLSPDAIEEIERLTADTTRWLKRSPATPLASLFHPNKEEIWLHWTLLDSWRDRRRILSRRIFPLHIPRFVPYRQACDDSSGWRRRASDMRRSSNFLVTRFIRHVVSLVATARGAVRWFTTDVPNTE